MDQNHYLYYFAKNVARLRTIHALTQKEMAAIMGVGVGIVRKLEQGVPTPRMDCLVPLRVSQYFHISLDTLWKTEL